MNGGVYADKSYWIATEDWDGYFGNTAQNYPVDLDVYSKMGGFSNGYTPMFVVVGAGNPAKVYYNDNPNDFRAALRLAINEMPDPGIASTSVASFSKSAPLGSSVTDSFNLVSSGSGALNYYLAVDYVGSAAAGSTWHSNNFNSVLGYTNSGTGNWGLVAGGTWNGGTQCANAANTSTSIMTSAAFNTTGIGDRLWLEFRYGIQYYAGVYLRVDYSTDNGATWTQIFNMEDGGVATAKIELPVKSANTRLRFSANMVRSQGVHSIVRIDDVKVYSDDQAYRWLKFDQVNQWGEPTETGSILTGTSKNFNLTFDAAGLAEGVYNADIVITCTDPVNSPLAVPVTLTVISGGSLNAPSNVQTVSATSSEVNLGWDAVSGATIYYIYRSTDPYSGFAQIGSSGTNSYTDSSVSAGNKYFYYITAADSKK